MNVMRRKYEVLITKSEMYEISNTTVVVTTLWQKRFSFFWSRSQLDSIAYSQNYQFLTYFIPCPVSIKTEKRPPKSCLGVFKRDENSYEYDFHNLAPIDAKYDEGPIFISNSGKYIVVVNVDPLAAPVGLKIFHSTGELYKAYPLEDILTNEQLDSVPGFDRSVLWFQSGYFKWKQDIFSFLGPAREFPRSSSGFSRKTRWKAETKPYAYSIDLSTGEVSTYSR